MTAFCLPGPCRVENPPQAELTISYTSLPILSSERHGVLGLAREPWAARLVHEADGRVFLDERDLWPDTGGFASTHVVATPGVIKEYPYLVEKWLKAHVEVTRWINTHPEEAKEIINAELKRITIKGLPEEVLNEAFGRVEFTYEPFAKSVEAFANYAHELGFLIKKPDLSNLYSLGLLNKVLAEDGLRPVAKIGD